MEVKGSVLFGVFSFFDDSSEKRGPRQGRQPLYIHHSKTRTREMVSRQNTSCGTMCASSPLPVPPAAPTSPSFGAPLPLVALDLEGGLSSPGPAATLTPLKNSFSYAGVSIMHVPFQSCTPRPVKRRSFNYEPPFSHFISHFCIFVSHFHTKYRFQSIFGSKKCLCIGLQG